MERGRGLEPPFYPWDPILALLQIAPGTGRATSRPPRMKLVAGPVAATGLSGYDPEHSTASVPRDKKSQTAGLEPTPQLERSWQTSVDYPVYQKPEKREGGGIRTHIHRSH